MTAGLRTCMRSTTALRAAAKRASLSGHCEHVAGAGDADRQLSRGVCCGVRKSNEPPREKPPYETEDRIRSTPLV